ncbi:MAG: hypothetical protein HRU41_41365 [Saprospiraceae bacterium]|nr:hypothetical protein [Saprospiraceae bacterium]
MANPIKASDLFKDDGAIQSAIDQLQELQKEYQSALDKIKKDALSLQVSIKKVNSTTSQQREEIRKTAKQADVLEREYMKYNKALEQNNVEIQRLRKAKRELNNIAKLEAQLADNAEGSYNKLAAQYALNKIELNKMSKEMREGTKAGRALEKQSKEIFEEMKRLQEATGKYTLNVGNYKEAIRDATSGSIGFSKALSLIAKTPILGVITAVVAAVTGLFSAFKRTEAGAKLLAQATGFLNAIFSQVIGLSNQIFSALQKAFKDPQEAVRGLWEAIKENIVNRFEGLIELFKAVGLGLRSLWKRDLKGIQQAGEGAAKALIKMTTGLDEEQQRRFKEEVEKTTKAVQAQTNAFIELELQKRRVVKANRAIIRTIEGLITKEGLYQSIADDTTKSFKEREAAAENARKTIESRARQEIQLARNNLGLITSEIKLRKANGEAVDDLLDQQLAAYKDLASAERDYTLSVRENEKTRAELKQDRLERDLDILIDGFDNQKAINERLLQDDRLTFEARAEILRDTQQQFEDSFNKQIETIQQFTGVQVDANDLVKESDAVVLNEKIRALGLSEVIEGRLLEIIKERKTAVLDLKDAEVDLLRQRQLFGVIDPIALPLQKELDKVDDVLQKYRDKAKASATTGDTPTSLFDYLGINIDDEGKERFRSAIDFAKQQLQSFLSERTRITDQLVANADREVQAAQSALERETQNRNAGFANRVQQAEEELRIAKSNQEKALREQERAQRAERRLQTVQQAQNLVTAVSKLWVKPGWPLALPLTALMFGSFAAAKIRAGRLAKNEFAEGGLEIIGGGSHASGNDTPLGFNVGGKPAYAEKGEAHMILKPGPTRKYKSILPDIFQALNSATFEERFQKINQASNGIPVFNFSQTGTDTSRMEGELAAIRKQGEIKESRDSQGRRIVKRGNVTRIYV